RNKMDQIFNLSTWKLQNPDLLQQLALLAYLDKPTENAEMLKTITGIRVAAELYDRVSSQSTIEAYQTEFYMAIADFVKKHPNSGEAALKKELEKQVAIFAQKVDKL
ncbi:unnamed protein product, partial [Owenia fusiformis]